MTGVQQATREEKCVEDTVCKFGLESIFGKYSDAEMVGQLKKLAVDPCNSEFSETKIRPLWNQTLRLRKAMATAGVDIPRRKRQLQQLLKELPGSGSWLSYQPSGTKLSRGLVSHASSASCLLNAIEPAGSFGRKFDLESNSSNSQLTFEDNILDKHVNTGSPFVDSQDVTYVADSDESANRSNTGSPENMTSQEVPSRNVHGNTHPSGSQAKDSPIKKHFEPRRQSNRLLPFIGDDPQRMVIPVGPRFQADVPEWAGPQNVCDAESSKWLGTRMWPIEGRKGSSAKAIGQGRSKSCSCSSPGSADCIRRHIIEERLLLLCELGGAFFRMKLDETGEQISKSWTSDEQHKYELFMNRHRHSDGDVFLNRAMKCFPNKSRKAIMSYYFNVFIPRQMGDQTRLLKQVDTDDEEESPNSSDTRKSSGKKAISSPKDVKDRFLRRP